MIIQNPTIVFLIYKFIPGGNFFQYVKSRYPREDVKRFDKLIHFRCKIAVERRRICFFNECMQTNRFPRNFDKDLKRLKITNSNGNLRRMARSKIEEAERVISRLQTNCDRLKTEMGTMSWYFKVRLYKYSQKCCSTAIQKAYDRMQQSVVNVFPDTTKTLHNLSSHQLSNVEKEALAFGLRFCVPKSAKQLDTETAFESAFQQLSSLTPANPDAIGLMKARLTDIAHKYRNSRVSTRHPFTKKHYQALEKLRSNTSLVITKPDKGKGTVVMDKCDYVNKMEEILRGEQFQLVNENDDTEHLQKKVIDKLDILLQAQVIDGTTYKKAKPIGTQMPRLYGLPKTHKPNVPMRPILSMIRSPTHELAKILTSLLSPVKEKLCKYSVKDTFSFIEKVKHLNVRGLHMCSLDVSSLFTNVPLEETVDFLCNYVHKESIQLKVPITDLKDMILLCTKNVQFAFNDNLYRQVDGVAMGSSLGPLLAEIFMAKLEEQADKRGEIARHKLYARYVDDIILITSCKRASANMLMKCNKWHSNIKFTIENEEADKLPFLDVLLERKTDGTLDRSVYRKPTATDQHLHFESFTPRKWKRALVQTLFDRARRICTADKLDAQLLKLTETLEQNGYPRYFIQKYSEEQKRTPVQLAKKKQIFVKLQYRGEDTMRCTWKQMQNAVNLAYATAEVCIVSNTSNLSLASPKQPISTLSQSHIIYKYECACGRFYIGKTARWLSKRVREHIPAYLQSGNTSGRENKGTAITQHCIETSCVPSYDKFSIIARAKNKAELNGLEAVAIRLFKPTLCKQLEHVQALRLPWS